MPDLLLAQETLVEDEVALVLEMRHLQHDRPAGLRVAGAKQRRHAAARDDVGELVLIERLARCELPHAAANLTGSRQTRQAERRRTPSVDRVRAMRSAPETPPAPRQRRL